MAKQLADVEIHAADSDDLSEKDVSIDLIDDRLYLGNLAAACDTKTLEKLKITHILTIDSVPLPRTILDGTRLTIKYVKLADVPKEDLITQLPTTNDFIKQALDDGGTILVHCYFGVSRSASVVIAYLMEKYSLCYEDAFEIVKSKRRFIGPNLGFIAQLKLFGHMGFKLNREDPRYKQFRLKLAGQKLKQVKILPQLFADLIKSDPGLTYERPHPIVYRCKKCRRIVASQGNLIPHIPKAVKVELAKKGIRPPPCKVASLNCVENGQVLVEKLKSLACKILESTSSVESDNVPDSSQTNTDENDVKKDFSKQSSSDSDVLQAGSSGTIDQDSDITDGNVDVNIAARADAPEVCKMMWFVEPMAWMVGIQQQSHGKLHCPKCQTKLGSFSWVMGCKCPCGQKVAPAFYLVPSKVEWSNIVQNVQVTI